MSHANHSYRAAFAAVLVLLIGAGAAFGQLQTGNLYGTVRDDRGEPLPGVAVTLTGVGATQVQSSNAQGEFRFLGLAPGGWAVKAELEGFSTVDFPSITLAVGRNTEIEITLTPAVEEVITVTSESPLLDERKIGTGTTVTQTELEKIPTARDPWVILQQTPGVLVDRVNVGGNESGQQSIYTSPGTARDNAVWAVDGVVITDMGAIGSSPTYFNFDSFEEMQVTTGGTDAALATGGVTMNMVTKRGTNEWRFSGRYLVAEDSWQSDLDFDDGDLGPGQPRFQQGNAIVRIEDFGAEGGGPILRDRLWVWGSYGTQEIDLLTLSGVQGATGPGTHDATELPSYAAKLNAQLTSNNSLTAFYHFGDKTKSGRGASPTRPAPTTWNQSGPAEIYKLEDTQIFDANFYLTGMASTIESGFQLAPIGGGVGDPSFPNVVRVRVPGVGNVWQNSFRHFETERPADTYRVDGNYFFNLASTSHELRFGAGFRDTEVRSFSSWPGQQIVGLQSNSLPGSLCGGRSPCYVGFNRTERNAADQVEYSSLYAQDTFTLGRLTANLGLRYDLQEGTNLPATISAPPVPFRQPFSSETFQGGGRFPGGDPGFEWESITPRLGLTYALGPDHTTLLRLSYSQFADQLAAGTVSVTNPANYQYGYFAWFDADNDLALTADEVTNYFAFIGVDPSRPGLFPLNLTDPGFDPPKTDEVVAGVEHALLPEFVIGASLTWRRYSDVIDGALTTLDGERLIIDPDSPAGSIGRPHRPSDYLLTHRVVGTLPDGRAFDVPVYTLDPSLGWNGGYLQENSDREQEYLGLSLTFNKRLANRWLLRGHLTWSDWEWTVPASEIEDPNQVLPGVFLDGGAVLLQAGTISGAKSNVFIDSDWSFDVSGYYEVAPDRPWGFNVAANVNGRQGYPLPYYVQLDPGDAISTRNVLVVSDVEDTRADDIFILNARLEKEIAFDDWGLTLSVDGFNLLNNSSALQRETNITGTLVDLSTGATTPAGSSAPDFVREVVSPRVFRIGARISLR